MDVYRRFGKTYSIHLHGFLLVAYTAYSTILKMAVSTSGKSVKLYRTTRRQIAEDGIHDQQLLDAQHFSLTL
jgi:hypothetical protein